MSRNTFNATAKVFSCTFTANKHHIYRNTFLRFIIAKSWCFEIDEFGKRKMSFSTFWVRICHLNDLTSIMHLRRQTYLDPAFTSVNSFSLACFAFCLDWPQSFQMAVLKNAFVGRWSVQSLFSGSRKSRTPNETDKRV